MKQRREKKAKLKPQALDGAPGLKPEDAIHTGRKIGSLLVEAKLITDQQLEEALLQQSASGKKLGALLVELGAIDERNMAVKLAEQLGLSWVDLRTAVPTPEALALLSAQQARELQVVPLINLGESVTFAVGDPTDPGLIAKLRQAVGTNVEIVVAAPTDVLQTINAAYRAIAGIGAHVEAFQSVEAVRRNQVQAVEQASEDAPVIRVVNLLISQGLNDRASDIHLEPQEGRLRVRYRIDGALHDVLALPENIAPAVVSRIKIMGSMNIVERQRPQDGQIEMNIDGRPLDIRVSTTPTIWGEKAVLRLLDKSKPLFRLDDLGMAPDVHAQFLSMVRAPVGMVICAGPTGSGKTTTLYSTLSEVNSSERNVMTIEDPVEYVFPSINQIQIREHAGVNFADGLRSILRQDPDVILVGEIRDIETARIAVQSALTGHFVLSSIHANGAVAALYRFLDMGIESYLIASAITGLMGQRLVRRICTHCKVGYDPTEEELEFFTESGGLLVERVGRTKAARKPQFWHGEGCNFCSRTGYLERIGVYELLRITDEIKQLVVRHAAQEKLLSTAIRQGMNPLNIQGIRLVEQGVTTIAEVLRSVHSV